MPLPGALLFPHALLPLHIFEPRYREMLKHALAHHRMFCVALLKPHCVEWNSTADFFQIATVGLIRACVEGSDGTSNLILQGLERVTFRAFQQVEPFPIATIESLESDPPRLWKPGTGRESAGTCLNLKGDRLRQLPPSRPVSFRFE
jgi:Lon protease-like protein